MVRLALASRIANRFAAEPGSGASPGTSVSVMVSTPVPGKFLKARSGGAYVKTSNRSRAAEEATPGRPRNSHWNAQSRATMLRAVPPAITPT